MPRNKRSDPYENDCMVIGCPNISHKRGVCRTHWLAIPESLRRELWFEQFRAMFEASSRATTAVAEFYAGQVKPESERLSPARRAHAQGLARSGARP